MLYGWKNTLRNTGHKSYCFTMSLDRTGNRGTDRLSDLSKVIIRGRANLFSKLQS